MESLNNSQDINQKSSQEDMFKALAEQIILMSEQGMQPEEIIYGFLQEGYEPEMLAPVFEMIGYDTNQFQELLQNVMQKGNTKPMQNEKSQEEVYQEEMQFGGGIRNFMSRIDPSLMDYNSVRQPKPYYIPKVPRTPDIGMALNFAGESLMNLVDPTEDKQFKTKKGTFRDWQNKQYIYQEKMNEALGRKPKVNVGPRSKMAMYDLNMNTPSIRNKTEESSLNNVFDYINNKFQNGGENELSFPEVEVLGRPISRKQKLGYEELNTPFWKVGKRFREKDQRKTNIAQNGKEIYSNPYFTTSTNIPLPTPLTQDQIDKSYEKSSIYDSLPDAGRLKNAAQTFMQYNPYFNAYTDLSNIAVQGANLYNQFANQREYNRGMSQFRNQMVADNSFNTRFNPVNKRGTWDVNSGLAEPDNLTTFYPRMQNGGEFEVDNDTLAQLIAAGADLEII